MTVCLHYAPLGPGVVALDCIGTGLALQVPANGKQETLENCHAHSDPAIPHLRDDVDNPAISLRVVALHVAQGFVLRHSSCVTHNERITSSYILRDSTEAVYIYTLTMRMCIYSTLTENEGL